MYDILINLYASAAAGIADGSFIQQSFGYVMIAVVLFIAVHITLNIFRSRHRGRAGRQERMFSTQQKNMGHRRAGGRCECSTGPFSKRCNRPAEHGDHFYPYAHGGATSMQNFVSACAFHNLSKGAKIPSAVEKSRIEARRRSYFPVLESRKVGEWA